MCALLIKMVEFHDTKYKEVVLLVKCAMFDKVVILLMKECTKVNC